MTSFAEYQPQYHFQNDNSYFSGDMSRQTELDQQMQILKNKSPAQLSPSPQSDRMYPSYQPMNVNDSCNNSSNFNTSPDDFNINNTTYAPEQLTELLNCGKLYIPNYDSAGFMYNQSYTEMATDSNTISWGALYTSPQQSSEFECYQPVANGYQFTPFSQNTYSNEADLSSCSSMDPTCMNGALTGPLMSMYHQTQSIPISSSNSISSSDSSSTTPPPTTTRKGGKLNQETQLKTSKNTADSKMKKLLKNREAAAKCRKKKREYLKTTKTLIEAVSTENYQLEENILRLREEIVDMKLLLANIDH